MSDVLPYLVEVRSEVRCWAENHVIGSNRNFLNDVGYVRKISIGYKPGFWSKQIGKTSLFIFSLRKNWPRTKGIIDGLENYTSFSCEITKYML